MKKILLFALVAIMSVAASAQQFKMDKSMSFGPRQAAKHEAPAYANSIEGTDLWGYYMGSNAGELNGLGTGAAGSFRVAIKVPGNGVLAGTKIRGINVPVLGAVTNAKAWVATGLSNSTIKVSKEFTYSNANAKYIVVEFDEPYEIPASGLYAGYTFTSNAAYPIAITGGEDIPGGLFLSTTATGALQDYSDQGFGVSGVQIFVEGMVLPENGVSVADVSCEAVATGTEGTALVKLSSDGSNGAATVGYTLNVNGVETTGTATPNIPAGMGKSGIIEVPFTAPNEIGAFNATIAINTVNGAANELSTEPVSFTINTVSRVVPRMTVIEEFTGTGCGYCPRGWVGMENVKAKQSDKALVIAWHNYNSSDAMYQANYASLNFSGAPQCTVDRKTYPDPYYGEGEEGIMECVNNYNTTVPTVDIKVKANFVDETNKQVQVTANTEFLTNTTGYTIAFVLTADSLTGTTTAWKQSNYYYSYSAAQAGILDDMPELKYFCSGGKWGKSSVQIVFNDAMIGSTYTSAGKSQVPAFTTGQAGDIETSEYTMTMPTKSALVNALKYDQIYVTALVIDKNGQIANAARVRVLGAGEVDDDDDNDDPIDIDGIKVSIMDDETQLMGEAMSPNAKYVVGANFATYAPSAWDVENDEFIDFPDFEEGSFHAANSNGLLVGDDGQGEGFAIKAEFDGGVTHLYRFEGEEVETEWGTISTGDAGSSAYAVSEDGKIIAGFYFDSAYKTTACIWNENNERIDLPVPSYEEAGFEINGAQARYMTPDGKVILGFVVDNFSTWPACIWRQNATGGYDVDLICKDFWEEDYQQGKPYMVFNPTAISANGEWVALQIQKEYDSWNWDVPQPTLQIARLNLNTKALEVLAEEEIAYTPSGIANDGTMLAYTGGQDMMGRAGYIWAAGKTEVKSIDDALVAVPELADLASNTPCTITADGKYIQGFGICGQEIFSYVIDYDQTTGISDVKVNKLNIPADRIYNINGQQVQNMNRRGLYIVNGKKILK